MVCRAPAEGCFSNVMSSSLIAHFPPDGAVALLEIQKMRTGGEGGEVDRGETYVADPSQTEERGGVPAHRYHIAIWTA